MRIGEPCGPVSIGCKVAGGIFIVFGLGVWLYWMQFPRTQGVVRMEPGIERGKDVIRPAVRPVERGEAWVAYPSSSIFPLRYREGDSVTVLLLGKTAVVKQPLASVRKSPSTDFLIGGVLLSIGWYLGRSRARTAQTSEFHERAA